MGDRYIVVDDNDSGIQYTGTWSLIDGKPRDRDGNFGPTYRGTLHSTIAGQASFSYNYRGKNVVALRFFIFPTHNKQ